MEYIINGYDFKATTSTFPGGEEYIKIGKHPTFKGGVIQVNAALRSSTNVMQLLMLTDALRELAKNDKDTTFILNLSYLPYARQDRRCAKGESFSLKVFTKLINDLNYDMVLIDDCHSEVGLALLDRVFHSTQLTCITSTANTHNLAQDCDVVLAPDAGAAKKAQEVADCYKKPLVQCLKTRTDKGIEVQVLGDVKGKKVLVVDDICDGGGTFLALASAPGLAGSKELNLYVTHGIFSKGKQVLLDYYTKVEAYNDWT